MAQQRTDSSRRQVVPLPEAGSRARSLVRLQLLKGVLAGFLQILRLPLFLVQRHTISARIYRIVEDQARNSDRSDSHSSS
ncbi:MAG: hypothetical protein OSB09_07020 [Planctomycetota bacterium]|nr:hypothetical protein [Planctomycetota bacterium]